MPTSGGRPNQRGRTRRDLLEAALRVAGTDPAPTLEQIAEEARVSRATAYRYFPNVDDLLAEATLHLAFPDPSQLPDAAGDVVERLFIVDEKVEQMIAAHEPALRSMIASSSRRRSQAGDVPVRQNRRVPLIEAALAPARAEFAPRDYRQLVQALSLVIGTEAMLVFKDVLQLTPRQARDTRRWTIRSLVDAARQAR